MPSIYHSHFHLTRHVDAFLDFEGYAFVKFSNREMALAAIKGLNRSFTMRVKLIYFRYILLYPLSNAT